jgi:hypothetical protein
MKYLLFLLLLFSNPAIACKSYIIGFRGLNSAFDHLAFYEYARTRADCMVVFNHTDYKKVVRFVDKHRAPYELYGYSAGAATAMTVVKQANRKPGYVLTIGAYYNTDVDFGKYEINFDNFFDASGVGQKSPGIHVKNVSHDRMQRYVTEFFR